MYRVILIEAEPTNRELDAMVNEAIVREDIINEASKALPEEPVYSTTSGARVRQYYPNVDPEKNLAI